METIGLKLLTGVGDGKTNVEMCGAPQAKRRGRRMVVRTGTFRVNDAHTRMSIREEEYAHEV